MKILCFHVEKRNVYHVDLTKDGGEIIPIKDDEGSK